MRTKKTMPEGMELIKEVPTFNGYVIRKKGFAELGGSLAFIVYFKIGGNFPFFSFFFSLF